MKKVLRNIIPVVCLLSAVSCSLDEHSYMYIQADNYMNDASEAEKVLLNVYRDMVKDEVYGYQLSLMFTLPTDIARIEGNSTEGTSRLICSNAYSSSQVEVKNTYMALYKGVYDANWFLSEIEKKMQGYTREDRELATYYIAEARCLRALYYFELLRWFGHIALVTTPEDSYLPADSFTQAEPEDVYKFIEADLLAAIDVLPYAMDDSVRSSNDFRFSKGGAMGLLAKVYATWAGYPVHDTSKWADCADIAGKLIASGKHGLLDEADGGYEQLWYNTCNGIWDPTESLIEVSFYSPSLTGDLSYDSSGRIGKWNGVSAGSMIKGIRNVAYWRVIPTFINSWEKGDQDKRKAISYAEHRYGNAEKGEDFEMPIMEGYTLADAFAPEATEDMKKKFIGGITPGKWDTEKYVEEENYLIDGNMSNINWYILRYADVLLLYAEAINERDSGPNAAAYAAVNMVRRRGFGKPVEAASAECDLEEGLSYEYFQEAVRRERAYELAFEGHRRQDLVRWGIYYESIQKTAEELEMWLPGTKAIGYYICADYTRKNKHELMPIPLQEVDMADNFKQNPGW